jgi:hypothetical protein
MERAPARLYGDLNGGQFFEKTENQLILQKTPAPHPPKTPKTTPQKGITFFPSQPPPLQKTRLTHKPTNSFLTRIKFQLFPSKNK